jgi:hypothetical protein
MGCEYNDNRTGKCQLDDGIFEMPGVDEMGYCTCDENENPLKICEHYVRSEQNDNQNDKE